VAYKTVPGNTRDVYVLDVLSSVLQNGQSSRLYRSLVREKQLVANANAGMDERRGISPFFFFATVLPGKKVEDVEAAIYAEIDRIQREPIADWELTKAANSSRVSYYGAVRRAGQRAELLGESKAFYNNANLINEYIGNITAVTREDVQRVAKQYLVPNNRTVLIVTPAGAQGAQVGR